MYRTHVFLFREQVIVKFSFVSGNFVGNFASRLFWLDYVAVVPAGFRDRSRMNAVTAWMGWWRKMVGLPGRHVCRTIILLYRCVIIPPMIPR